MSIGTQSQTESAYLSSSVSSLQRPKKSTSEISKTYKHASQLYLTRRLVECYEAIQSAIKPLQKDGKDNQKGHVSASEDDSAPRSPIALANTSQRIKIWSLYATLLNAIVELDDEEGKRDFGNKLYREIVRNVQSGEVWEQVVKDGYMGREASVDAEVVYNLSNLLLAQAPNQSVNQARLETYLSSSPQGSIDFSSAFQNGHKSQTSNGMNTPKDLNSRIKILELFVLHVLPANNEWDYARSFISNSDILDDERRDAFMQTLNELQEAKEQEEADMAAEQDLVGFADGAEDEDVQDHNGRIHMNDDEGEVVQKSVNGDSKQQHDITQRKSSHHRSSSEVDYGIDDDLVKARSPQPPSITQSTAATTATSTVTASDRPASPTLSAPPPSNASATSRPITSPQRSSQPARKPSSAPVRKSPNTNNKASNSRSTNTPTNQLTRFFRVLTNITSTIATSLTRNPTQVFRTLMFLFAFLAVLARKDVRDRLRRMIGTSWVKLRQTAGMGVKVSYV
ncbi:hypothetical protein LTR64_008240 [Lithohypha guttulata]|uniref:uncharacterized protein n=1 Tax=Lithohypha guttulata TaxID=1690604 RepID=UPI002DE155D1|nr:hypothetical protein LTR51_008392 [Lithohypha guttulata]